MRLLALRDEEVAQFRATHSKRSNQLVHLISIMVVHIDAQHLAVQLFENSTVVPCLLQLALCIFFFLHVTEKTACWYVLLACIVTWLRATPSHAQGAVLSVLNLGAALPWW